VSALFDWLGQPLPQRLGWTLLHFLWQGALLALLHQLARAALHRRSAHARSVAGCLTLLLMAIAPVWTFVTLEPQVPRIHWTAGSTVATTLEPSRFFSPVTSPIAASTSSSGVLPALTSLASASVPWITLFWVAGVLALSLRTTQEQVDTTLQVNAAVEIVERAEPSLRPVRFRRPAWVTPAGGLGLACCLAGLALHVLGRRPPLAGTPSAPTLPAPAVSH
jgi:hypothetical protein